MAVLGLIDYSVWHHLNMSWHQLNVGILLAVCLLSPFGFYITVCVYGLYGEVYSDSYTQHDKCSTFVSVFNAVYNN